MNFPKYYIGPMSKNVVDCVLKHGQHHQVGFIPSRRQIDFCGGYVNGWNTEEFSKYVRGRSDNILLCRDHGGESQGQDVDDGMQSFLNDSSNFDLIHVDPFKVSNSMLEAVQKTTDVIKFLWDRNKNLVYEVGTEEAIYKYQPEELCWFLEYLRMGLGDAFHQIKYAVVQSGTRLDLSTRTNTGNFSKRRLKNFIKVVRKYGLMSKEHNGDYLTDSFDVELRFECGLDAINIAPEFGQIESEYYLEECKKDKELFEELYHLCYNSNKWKKWIKDVERVSKSQLIMTCCHYVLSDDCFLKKIKINFPNSDFEIKQKINLKLNLLYEQTKNYCI